ncbi:MAG: GAF domain-containing protein, partial [Myxococcales bacterium]|nr:GAF domain-containing protein [Myxococcales bacterium]
VGDGAALLGELLPELTMLLGEPTAPAPELPKTEAAQRFRSLFDALLRGLATARTPFVVVIDDLQWIDPSSAAALGRFFEEPRGYALLLVAAYRGDGLAADHPLRDLREQSAASGATVTHLNLTPLTVGDTVALLRDSLVPAAASLRGLAEYVHGRTGGNPLYTRVLLETLHDEDKIRFDVARGSWSWELGEDAPDVDLDALLRSRLDGLPEDTRAVLGAAACIGPRFDIDRLGKLIERGATELADLLAPALDNGVLRSISEPYSPSLTYAFAHEGLAELALAVVDADALRSFHWRIGQILLDDGAGEDDRIFTAVSHLVRGFAGGDGQRPADLAHLTLAAGQRATLAGAYEAASRYLGQGIALMPASAWRSDHELMLKLHVGLAEARQLLGHFEVAEALFERALAETRSPLDRAELLALKIRREIGLRRFEDALNTGDAGLRLLGIKVPRRGTRTALTVELTRLRWRMRKRTSRHLLELPESLERRTFVAHTLLMYMTPAAYFSDFQLAAVLLLRLVNLSLERGRTDVTAFGVAGYALILAASESDYAGALEYAEIADELLELLPSPAIAPRVDLFVGLFILPWTRPLFDAKGRLERGYLRARERGDHTYASFCCGELAPLSYIAGTPLGRLQEQAADNAAFLRQVREFEGHAHATALVYFCRSLRGQTDETRRLGDEPEEEAAMLGAAARYHRTPAGFYIPLYKAILLYHTGEYAEAQLHLDAAAQVLTPMRAIATRAEHDLFSALNLAERATQAAPQDRRKLAERIAAHYDRLAAWERSSPANFGARARLAAAALAWAEGRTHAVLPELNAAIARAKEADHPHYEGLAAEIAARFVVATDTDFLLEHYLAIAFDAYQRYGAIAKIGALRTAYGERNQAKESASRVPTETSTLVPIDGSGGKSLDLGTVIKATQALSGEIVLDRLLDTLVRIVMENAGARRCFLVLDHEGRLLVEAEGSVDPEKVEVLRSTPLEEQGNLPLSILKYVARSATTVVLDNAAQTGAFTKDPFVRQQSLKSVLCMPISHQNKVMGVLYLENNLATDVFTDDRLELLNQLAAQLAISVDNARLYESLDRAREEAVGADQKKTRFLMTMSHELRTPLNAIIGYTELIEEDLMDGVTDGFVDDLGSIQTAALRLERTLESALELSRIEAGTFEIDLEEVAVEELVRDVLSELRPALAASGNHLDVDVGNIGVILSDRLRLRYCLRSVLDNAIRFTEGGRVSLKIAADEDSAPATLEVVVSDNGIGISDEHMERIFEAFTQADDSTTRLFEGSGVSLAVTRHICVALGGSIEAESKVGAGSRFTISLPLRRAALSTSPSK